MKFDICILCSLSLVAAAHGSHAAVTPVQKVLTMMGGMLEKGKKEKHDEKVQFEEYSQFCRETTIKKNHAIEDADAKIDFLSADIQKCSSAAQQLTKDIAGLDEDIATLEADIKAATKERQMEKSDYEETHADYTESLDALTRAIVTLKSQDRDRKQKASLVQVAAVAKLKRIPPNEKQVLDAFLDFGVNEEGKESATGAPEANAYEFKSNGVVDLLQNMMDKFEDEKDALENEETNEQHAYEMFMTDTQRQLSQAKEDRDLKAESKAKRLQQKADTSGNLDDVTASKNADVKYLTDLQATCQQKASDFQSQQKMRGEEIEAIEKAMKIISSGAVAGNAEKHASLLQKGTAYPQLRSNVRTWNQDRVAQYLQLRATSLHSRVLAAAALRAASDPFGKVKKMVKDLITRLTDEANEEAEHKGWCDTELSTNAQTRKEKTEAVETLNAEIDQLKASISELSDDVGELTNGVAELDAAMSKATKLRRAEEAKNAETVGDADAAQAAVAQALTVLKAFYSKAGEATALVQQPETSEEEYGGMQGASTGVLGMLEVIMSDFARLESETRGSEASAKKEYEDFMTDSSSDKTEKSEAIEHKSAKKQDLSQDLQEKQGDLEATQDELDSALAYYDKLKPDCIDAGVSYEDRVSRRKEELASLQEALKVMNGETI